MHKYWVLLCAFCFGLALCKSLSKRVTCANCIFISLGHIKKFVRQKLWATKCSFYVCIVCGFFLPHEDFTHKTAGILQILLQNVILPPPLFLKEMINWFAVYSTADFTSPLSLWLSTVLFCTKCHDHEIIGSSNVFSQHFLHRRLMRVFAQRC